ncbi:heat shock protein beta-3 [Amia ocellicauda]|uniref:heat shock protein beta-3 n=1 Tax=Amia ocellicauda TaxID=2972642 RepID=UPI003463B668
MAEVTIRHWVRSPVRYQALFEGRNLEECKEDHCLFALPGPSFAGPRCETATESSNSKQGGETAFQVLLDVAQFRPEDILIQVYEGWLLVRGQHSPRMDEHGFISRSFTRQYRLPDTLQVGDLRAMLCHDGILVVEAKDCGHGTN